MNMSPKRKREQRMMTAAIALLFMAVLVGSSLLMMTLMFNPASSRTAIVLTGESQDPLISTIAVPPTHPTATR
jgi:hypothetical protein